MQLDPRHLDALSQVLIHSSFTAASVSLNLSLAAVSLRVKALEETVGQRLVIRGKTVRATPAGRLLLAHYKQLELLNNDLAEKLQPAGKGQAILPIAVNADSLASWFLPGLLNDLQSSRLLLDIHVEDQDHTLDLLKAGAVVGCITAQEKPVAGCIAQPLGAMHYRCVAAPELRDKIWLHNRNSERLAQGKRAVTIQEVLAYPALCFNRKDGLQDLFLSEHFGLTMIGYPRHYVPAVDAFHMALISGIGWGMEATIQGGSDFKNKRLVELFPGKTVKVPLYWQHWSRETRTAQHLTNAILKAAKKYLR